MSREVRTGNFETTGEWASACFFKSPNILRTRLKAPLAFFQQFSNAPEEASQQYSQISKTELHCVYLKNLALFNKSILSIWIMRSPTVRLSILLALIGRWTDSGRERLEAVINLSSPKNEMAEEYEEHLKLEPLGQFRNEFASNTKVASSCMELSNPWTRFAYRCPSPTWEAIGCLAYRGQCLLETNRAGKLLR